MKRIALFGGSFNPPALHHKKIAEELASLPEIDEIVVIPCGGRKDKLSINDIDPIHRAAMADLTFAGITKVRVDLFDLENGTFTALVDLQKRYEAQGEIWHYVGADLVQDAADSQSIIQKTWKEGPTVFETLNFIVGMRPGYDLETADCPRNRKILKLGFGNSSQLIREKAFRHESLDGLVTPEVADYIERHRLYRGLSVGLPVNHTIVDPRPLILSDPTNQKAVDIAKRLKGVDDEGNPNLLVVIGGDGFMMHSIRENWWRRLPFFGINAGHRGHLLNNIASDVDERTFRREMWFYQSPMLKVETLYESGELISVLACNDAWVQAPRTEIDPAGAVWLKVSFDGEVRIERLIADGILVATPAGSTAYTRSMGGGILPIGTQSLAVVGDNVFEPIGWKSANPSIDSVIEFEDVDPTCDKRKVLGYFDSLPLGRIRKMTVRASRIAAAELAYLPGFRPEEKMLNTQFLREVR